ncbi:MAG: hypothetical protein WC002_08565 [Candidatus Muiribacteriota bacterium]
MDKIKIPDIRDFSETKIYKEVTSDPEKFLKAGAKISDFIFKPVFSLIPSFCKNSFLKLTEYEVFLTAISKFSFGVFLGATFPKFFKKHRLKLLIISILASLPLFYKFIKNQEP